MDPTTITVVLLVALGILGVDTVRHSDNLIVEVVAPPRSDKISIDEATLEQTFETQLHVIAATRSLVDPPEIRASRQQGIGLALAEAVHVKGVAYALQTELGYASDRLRLALYVHNGTLQGLVTGSSHTGVKFEQVMTPRDNESLPSLVRRAALFGASQLAPYTTALYLLQLHSGDKEFADVLTLVEHAKAKLPPTPVNLQRSLYENLRGIVALFQNDAKAAKAAFASALDADPSNPVAVLNMAFAEIQVDEDRLAAERMQRLLTEAPPTNTVLLATAYITWAAAEMGHHNPAHADELLAKAMQIYPTSSTGFDLWAEAKETMGDHAAAVTLRRQALEATSDTFENYAEVAALYFHLAWQDNQPVMRNRFTDPPAVSFR